MALFVSITCKKEKHRITGIMLCLILAVCFPEVPAVDCPLDYSNPASTYYRHTVLKFHEKLTNSGLNKNKTPVLSDRNSCFTDLSENDLSKTDTTVYIDTRNSKKKDDFANNTISVPLAMLKNKLFLRNKEITLIHDSHNYYTIADLCNELKHSGIPEISIFVGGMNIWNKHNQGNALLTHPGLMYLKARDLYSLSLEGMWVVLEIINGGSPISSGNLHQIKKENVSNLKARLNEIINEYTNKFEHAPNILIADNDGKGYTGISKSLDMKDAVNIFYLEGGTSGFNSFSEKHSNLSNKRLYEQTSPKECAK